MVVQQAHVANVATLLWTLLLPLLLLPPLPLLLCFFLLLHSTTSELPATESFRRVNECVTDAARVRLCKEYNG